MTIKENRKSLIHEQYLNHSSFWFSSCVVKCTLFGLSQAPHGFKSAVKKHYLKVH